MTTPLSDETRPSPVPAVDVVIVNYRSADSLEHCLRSILPDSREMNLNIFVVDNTERDELNGVREKFSAATYVRSGSNVGYARGMNRAIKMGTAPFVLMVNPDLFLNAGALKAMLGFIGDRPETGIVAPRLHNPDGTVQGSARVFPNALAALAGRNSILVRKFPRSFLARLFFFSHRGEDAAWAEVDWVSGACMLARRTVLEHVGGFDENYFLYWEDVDLCKRVWDSGYKVIYYRGATADHPSGMSSRHNPVRSLFEFHRSAFRYLSTHSVVQVPVLRPMLVGSYAAGLLVRLLLSYGLLGIRRIRRYVTFMMYRRSQAAPGG